MAPSTRQNTGSMTALTHGQKTDVGRVRKANQDSLAVVEADGLDRCADALFVVADGMGGRAGGEIASLLTVQTIPDVVRDVLAGQNGAAPDEAMSAALREGIVAANEAVWARSRSTPDLRGMGTTCVAALVKGDLAAVGHVGDSRIYRLREGVLTQLTEDHSLVQEHVRAGDLTRAEARASRYKNVITRAIGAANEVEPEIKLIDLLVGDTLLLCSDGLPTSSRSARSPNSSVRFQMCRRRASGLSRRPMSGAVSTTSPRSRSDGARSLRLRRFRPPRITSSIQRPLGRPMDPEDFRGRFCSS